MEMNFDNLLPYLSVGKKERKKNEDEE